MLHSKYGFVWSEKKELDDSQLSVASFSVHSDGHHRNYKPCDFNPSQTCLYINFTFERTFFPALISMYFPSGLIVSISFLSFWIEASAVPGRVTLVVTSLLALVTQLLSVRDRMPSVLLRYSFGYLVLCMFESGFAFRSLSSLWLIP